jgi:hypothetical protein
MIASFTTQTDSDVKERKLVKKLKVILTTTPTRERIYQEAKRLFFQHELRNGNSCPNNPEYSELLESGYVAQAQSNLMTSNPYKIVIEKQTESDRLSEIRQRDLAACRGQVKLIPDGLLAEILKTGLIVASGKGHGKTNSVKVIASEILKRNVAKVKVFDSALNWIFDFSELRYQLVTQDKDGLQLQFENIDNCVYDLTFINDPKQINRVIRHVIALDFNTYATAKLLSHGHVNNWLVYIIEEAQNFIGSSALRSYRNRFWLKVISTGRNIGLSFIFVTQRLADVSSKAVERCQGYLVGKMLGDNDLRKLRSIAGKEISWLVRDLPVGSFYYYSGQRRLIQFPLYQKTSIPEEYCQPQTPTLWQKLLGRS